MIFDFKSTDPLTSRQRFKSRAIENFAALSGIFIVLVAVLSLFCSIFAPMFFAYLGADALALGTVYYLYVLWEKRTIRIRCEGCRKIILTNTPWVCGFCNQPNRNANDYPFVHKCAHCGDEPKTYKCHHCNELVFLAEDQDKLNYAFCINSPAEAPEADKTAETLKKHKDTIQKKRGMIEIEELNGQLESVRNRIRAGKKKPAKEALRESVDSIMEWEEAARELKAQIDEECKGNSDRRKRLHAAVDKQLREHLPG